MGKLSLVTLQGLGLHHGIHARVDIARSDGSLKLERDVVARPLEAFRVVSAERSTAIACDAFEVQTVEHLFAALAGCYVRSDCRVVIEGGLELPLLDGAARAYVEHLEQLGLEATPPPLRIARAGRIDVDGSTYQFEPGDGVRVVVHVDLPRSCAPEASWDGERASFGRIAEARTFALEADVEELSRLGLARHVDPRSVLVVCDDSIRGASPANADEPARHKLLDLLGDAYLYGGPPRGFMRASRPGHARNHRAFQKALERGILA
jgi:UDP-3-O-[3-hydroxymyristoyl] N-acetylglucosamine deacetylase